MSSTAQKPTPPQKPITATAFGVSITVGKQAADEHAPMSPKKKKLIIFTCLIGASALVLFWQYYPRNTLDSEAQNNPEVRKVVEMEQKKDSSGLAQMIKSDDSAAAARAVSSLANVSGIDAIRGAFDDRREEVRAAAVTALARNPGVEQLPELDQYAEDPAADVRIAAIRGISSIRDFSIFDSLFRKLSDPQPVVRRAALAAIEDRIGLKFPYYDPNGSPEQRAAAIGRMRTQASKMKQVFDQANEFELKHMKKK